MIVYVESNFVLELALLQEEHAGCSVLLDLAERRDLDLVIPMYSIGEPYEVWVRRTRQRRELFNRLRTEVNQLARSEPYRELTEELLELVELLARSGEEEKDRLDRALERILAVAAVVPIGAGAFGAALTFQRERGLSPQDSIV